MTISSKLCSDMLGYQNNQACTEVYIYITARLGGQYGGIFSSRLAVLARAQRGTIQKPRTEYSPVLPDPKECSNRFIA